MNIRVTAQTEFWFRWSPIGSVYSSLGLEKIIEKNKRRGVLLKFFIVICFVGIKDFSTCHCKCFVVFIKRQVFDISVQKSYLTSSKGNLSLQKYFQKTEDVPRTNLFLLAVQIID